GYTRIHVYFYLLKEEYRPFVIDWREVKEKTSLWSGNHAFMTQVTAALESADNYVPITIDELPKTLIKVEGKTAVTYDPKKVVRGVNDDAIPYVEIPRAPSQDSDVTISIDDYKIISVRRRTVDFKQDVNLVAEPQRSIVLQDKVVRNMSEF